MAESKYDRSSTHPKLNYYSRYDSGHRGSYAATIERELGARRTGLLPAFLSSDPFLFLMIEERTMIYVVTCLFRAIFGRATIGLLFQPGLTLRRDNWRRILKYALLRSIRNMFACRTIAIEPFDDSSEFNKICDDWIYDFQLWDLTEPELAYVTSLRIALLGNMSDGSADTAGALVRAIVEQRDERLVHCAIGRQDRTKGFDHFTKLYAENPDVRARFLFAFGGQVVDELAPDLAAFEAVGGVGENRRISDDNILDLYAVADLVWCHYAIDYDQSSGVFGRAIQLGIPVLVRRGSRIHHFCLAEKLAHIATDVDDLNMSLPSIIPQRIEPPVMTSMLRKKTSLNKLHDY